MNDGGPAFPRVAHNHNTGKDTGSEGMSLRDWFAGQALAGLALQTVKEARAGTKADGAAGVCYLLADAMIAARPKPTE